MPTQSLYELLFGAHPAYTTAYPENKSTITDIISNILPNIYIFAGLIVFLLLVFGGFQVIKGAGDPKATEQGKDTVTKAVIGFLIIFTSYWIIQIVQVITGIPILNSSL